MTFITYLIDLILHVDEHLQLIIAQYGVLTYAVLFGVIFCETGLVIMPFLPGDSLLFAAGAFAAKGSFHPVLLFVLLSAAAILGDTVNYAIGYRIGPAVFRKNYRFLNHQHLLKAEKFYEKHGAKTIVIARFLPIIRTLAPFVAGVGKMDYGTFAVYNIVGGLVWLALFTFGGYFFGGIPVVEKNFEIVIVAIIGLSILPPVIELIRHKMKPDHELP